MNGYLAETYAKSLGVAGIPLYLPESRSWVHERKIANSSFTDIAGCYPLMACGDWAGLTKDLTNLQEKHVSFTMVTDPLGDFDLNTLQSTFPDLFKPFKTHYLTNLQGEVARSFSSNHVRNAKRALKNLTIKRETQPHAMLESWSTMYTNLIDRHEIKGIAAFSREAFDMQLQTPGIIVYSARLGDELVGMVLFYEMNNHVYYHLGAYLEAGYEMKASFGIFWTAINDFREAGLAYLNLGGGAGLQEQTDDGLARFKKGWSSEMKPAYLCGRVLNRPNYDKLVLENSRHSEGQSKAGGFFPAYRSWR